MPAASRGWGDITLTFILSPNQIQARRSCRGRVRPSTFPSQNLQGEPWRPEWPVGPRPRAPRHPNSSSWGQELSVATGWPALREPAAPPEPTGIRLRRSDGALSWVECGVMRVGPQRPGCWCPRLPLSPISVARVSSAHGAPSATCGSAGAGPQLGGEQRERLVSPDGC